MERFRPKPPAEAPKSAPKAAVIGWSLFPERTDLRDLPEALRFRRRIESEKVPLATVSEDSRGARRQPSTHRVTTQGHGHSPGRQPMDRLHDSAIAGDAGDVNRKTHEPGVDGIR